MRLDMVMSHDFCVVGRKKLWLCIPHIVKTIENYWEYYNVVKYGWL